MALSETTAKRTGAEASEMAMDPTRLWQQLWQQWYAALWRAPWAGGQPATPGGPRPADAFADPWGLAALWFPTAASAARPSGAPGAGAGAMPNPFEPTALWQWWLNGMLAMLPGTQPSPAATPGGDPSAWLARWQELLHAGMGANAGAGTTGAEAPLPPVAWTAFRQWYDATSGAWSQALDELVSSPAFAEAAGTFLDGYASSMTTLRRSSEQFAHALQLPTRADIARVAGLVVALEEKVDGIEQAQVDAADQVARIAREPLATAAALAALDARLTRLEAKLDRLLAATDAVAERVKRGNGGARAGREGRQASSIAPAPTTPAAAAASNGSAPRTHKPSTTARATRSRRQTSSSRTPPAP